MEDTYIKIFVPGNTDYSALAMLKARLQVEARKFLEAYKPQQKMSKEEMYAKLTKGIL